MKPIKGFEDVKPSGDFTQLPPGGYICMITNVEDVPDREYLKIDYDIATGEYGGYFTQMQEKFGWNSGRLYRSYKDTAVRMFKAFITAVEESNDGYTWNWKEDTLRAKVFGVVLGEEEYETNKGEVKVRMYANSVRSVDAIQKGDFKVPEKKLLNKKSGSPSGFQPLDDNLPF